jgi:hypothetical protein
MSKLSKQAAINELWRRGEISFLLDPNQKSLRALYHNTKEKVNVWLLARRSGKSYALLALAFEQCMTHPRSIVKYLGPTKLMIKTIARPLVETLLTTCPADLKPQLKESDYTYYFPNGSELQMAGADSGHAEKLRGGDSTLILVDEAGSIDRLKYIIQSVLIPTTLLTKGKLILASTPPVESEHDFLGYIEEAELNGTITKKTIYDNPRLTPQDIEDAKKEMGGEHTEGFQREYMCQILKNADTSVIPEFDDTLIKEVVIESVKPPFYDCYVAMDLGFKDYTALVFGYYDFKNAKIVIEDELLIDFKQSNMNLKKLAEAIKQKEEALWTNVLTNEVRQPSLRVSDIDYIVLQELYSASQGLISFAPAQKYDKEAVINNLRTLLSSRKLIINPRCVNLIRHLKNVKWNKNKQGFARSAENGHYDLVDALLYFIRHISTTKNPYPANYQLNTRDMFVYDKNRYDRKIAQQHNTYADVFRQVFNIKDKKYGGK